MNQIEKLTLNYHVNENKLQTLGEKIDKKRIADKKILSSKTQANLTREHATSISNLANLLNKVHFDKIKSVNNKKAHSNLKERVSMLKT